eukprot:scaffold2550_cov153-Skeletonema_menzelii.AAC.6
MRKNESQRREPLQNGQHVVLDNLPHNMTMKIRSSRKRGRAIVSLSSLVGAAILTACIICFSSAVVSAHDMINQKNVGKKKFIYVRRNKKRDLTGAWNWNEDDLPLTAVSSKSDKEASSWDAPPSNKEKSKSGKDDHSSSEWSSNWSQRSPRWSSPQKPTSVHPTPWKAAGHLPTTSRPTSTSGEETSNPTSTSGEETSNPTSKIPTEPTESPRSPTSKPGEDPTTSTPTTTPSLVSSTHPSSIPSSEPTSNPSSMPSYQPSFQPSIRPSFHPSSGPSAMPSSLPSESPSSSPTDSSKPTPAYLPSASPTVSSQPTSSPSANPSSSPTAVPVATASPLATASPTVSSKPTTSQRTARPTWAPTISHEPSWAERTRRPTWAPTISNEPTAADRTMRPTQSPATESPTSIPLPTRSPTTLPQTLPPTSSLVTDSREGLRMELFGLEFMDESQTALFQTRTAVYMQAFYNDTDSTNLLDLIKSQVTDLTAVIEVVDQSPPDLLGDFRGRTLMNGRRKLQDAVTDPCIGDPLTLTFNMELTYRTTDPLLELSDRVISFPFRTIPFRKDYLDNYLKADDGGAFDDLYCTSQMVFPGGDGTSAPTGAPTAPSTNGTMSPTVPSTNGTTLSPTASSTMNGTLSPNTTTQPSVAPSGSVSSEPTLSKKPSTTEPTSNSTSLSPTISNAPTISGNSTLSPTISNPPSFGSTSLPTTSTQEPLPRTDLRMRMFGLTELLDFAGVLLYNERTANYIESYYNDYNSTAGIRGQVFDVTAAVEITDQFVPEEEPLIEDELGLSRHGHNENGMVINEIDEDESYLPVYATDENSDNFINARYRVDGDNVGKKKVKGTRALQIDSCSGDRIELISTISLSYRMTNSSLAEDDIIADPFSTEKRRNIYMEDFLKGLDAGPFVNLTCTGRLLFPIGGIPTASPITATIVPTLDVERPSQQPTVSGTSNETNVPTLDVERPSQQPTVAGTSNETNVPTVSSTSNSTNATTSPPTVPGSFTTEVKSNVGQDLFGIPNLDPISTDVYNIQTAAYISAFYGEDPFVFVSTALVSVTDESIPIGPIEGSDCSQIDPLTVSFTIEMTYSTTNPVITFDEIIKLPFSTPSFQDTFINDYLRANDANGGFASLQCVSELMIPESLGTISPTETSMPSTSPTEFEDDLLEIRSGISPERNCLDKVEPELIDLSEEIEISVVYGVESTTADIFFLDELEGLILDFLQISIMMCLEGGERAPRVWKIDDQQDTAGVIRVRYPEIGEASTMCKFDTYMKLASFVSSHLCLSPANMSIDI